jgi:putative molybdopterin biosynthesis protein
MLFFRLRETRAGSGASGTAAIGAMNEFLTTREVAALLRVKERKVYDLVAEDALPVRRVTGKLLFPRIEIEKWIAGDNGVRATGAVLSIGETRPRIVGGGHDPLLEWALRESRSGLAAFFDGALDGLTRMAENGCLAAGLHIPESRGEEWNVAAAKKQFGAEPVVLIEWAKRRRGLMFREGGASPTKLSEIGDMRFQSRQPEAGSELILSMLLEREGLSRQKLRCVSAVERTETDLAAAVAAGRADVGLGVEAAARQFNLSFAPLVAERFDLLVWRKDYFDPPFQRLLRFCASDAFRARAETLGGYDVADLGVVHFNGP